MDKGIEVAFIELLQVAIGKKRLLSRTPSATDWDKFYHIACDQSLVGITFAAVQRLQAQYQTPPEMLYLNG